MKLDVIRSVSTNNLSSILSYFDRRVEGRSFGKCFVTRGSDIVMLNLILDKSACTYTWKIVCLQSIASHRISWQVPSVHWSYSITLFEFVLKFSMAGFDTCFQWTFERHFLTIRNQNFDATKSVEILILKMKKNLSTFFNLKDEKKINNFF